MADQTIPTHENIDSCEIDWETLGSELSEGTLNSLRQHLEESLHGDEAPEVRTATTPRTSGESALPSSNKAYKLKEYWDERFESEEHYDWLAGYADIAVHVRENVPLDAKVLIVGCGNSSLSAEMFDDGYRDVLSTDFSSVVIEKMSARNEARLPGLRWERMDMLALDLEDASVDAVLDKAAMDAFMVDRGDPWHPSPGVVSQAHRMCSDISRVLAPGGVFIQLSFEQPHFRRKMLLGDNIRAYLEADGPGGGGSCYRGSDLTVSGNETDETDETCRVRTSVRGHLVETTQGPRVSGGEDCFADVGDAETGDVVRYPHRRSPSQGACLEVDRGFYGWDLEVHEIQRESGCFGHFLYVMRKSGGQLGDGGC